MKRLTITVACLLLLVFSLALCPAAASATRITLNMPVEIKDIPADMGPLNLYAKFFDRNKIPLPGDFIWPFSDKCTVTGQTLSCNATISHQADMERAFYYQVIVRDKSNTPLSQALQTRGVILIGTPVLDTGIQPLNP